jgi:hypothetical protein
MTALRPIRIDTTSFPLVVTILDGKQTDADVDEYLREIAKLYARGDSFVTLAHIQDYAMTLSHVGKIAEAMKRLPIHHCKGSALAIPFPTFRFILSSYYLLHVPPHPIVVFEQRRQAEQWALQRLKDVGLPIPEALRAAG